LADYFDKFAFVDKELARRKAEHRFRRLKPVLPLCAVEIRADGRRMINFCSNDYLGLSRNETLRSRAVDYLSAYGAGSTASRLICGNYDIVEAAERKLARLKEMEAALIFNSGFQANVTVIPALADKNSLILSDRLNHNSIIQGARLSRGTVKIYRHNDPAHLAEQLDEAARQSFSRIIIVTESVFSMDGDISDLAAISALADRFGAIFIVDDAHATGVLGPKGMGLANGHLADVTIGTFSKGCGGFGAYVACSARLRDYLINCCPGFIYTTALPPAVIGGIDAALDLIPEMNTARSRLMDSAARVRQELNAMGFDTGASATQIIPVLIGDTQKTLSLSKWLADQGILALAIRPPTVPDGASRIRISLSAEHTPIHIGQLIEAFKGWRNQNEPG